MTGRGLGGAAKEEPRADLARGSSLRTASIKNIFIIILNKKEDFSGAPEKSHRILSADLRRRQSIPPLHYVPLHPC